MGNREFRDLLKATTRLSAQQRASLERALQRMRPNAEQALEKPEACPHCGEEDSIGWGRARGLQRWRCKGCRKTFTAVTNTRAQGLRHRDAWAEFAAALLDGETLKGIAARCGIHRTTAHRWRTRFLEGLVAKHGELAGIVEADETYLLHSVKGQPALRQALGRPPRKRGGKAVRRGLSREQVPVFMAIDRAGQISCRVSDRFNAASAREALEAILAEDAILCSDGHTAYRTAANELRVQHERVVHRDGGRVRGPFHIQNVNGAHSHFKTWIRRFNGMSTSRLPLFVAWFAWIERNRGKGATPNHVLENMLYA
jgi:transposase-like protein